MEEEDDYDNEIDGGFDPKLKSGGNPSKQPVRTGKDIN